MCGALLTCHGRFQSKGIAALATIFPSKYDEKMENEVFLSLAKTSLESENRHVENSDQRRVSPLAGAPTNTTIKLKYDAIFKNEHKNSVLLHLTIDISGKNERSAVPSSRWPKFSYTHGWKNRHPPHVIHGMSPKNTASTIKYSQRWLGRNVCAQYENTGTILRGCTPAHGGDGECSKVGDPGQEQDDRDIPSMRIYKNGLCTTRFTLCNSKFLAVPVSASTDMHIEEIILEGFKSYAARTVISGWDPQLNAITGLNGSGKSNILDAICFVLGIDNLRLIRANNLQDLVYKRGAAGINKATVTIIFNNESRESSPVGFSDSRQIAVTRQVNKSSVHRRSVACMYAGDTCLCVCGYNFTLPWCV